MRRTVGALIDGAASAIDLIGPTPERLAPREALAVYWTVSGTYLRDALEAHEDVRALQVPLFDAGALARGKESS